MRVLTLSKNKQSRKREDAASKLIMKCVGLLVVVMPGFWLAVPALADNGDSAVCDVPFFPCPASPKFGLVFSNHSRPGSVLVFPLFIRGGGNTEECGAGNVLVN